MRAGRAGIVLGCLPALLAAQQSIPAARMECPATADPKQQPAVALVLASGHSAPLSVRLTLAFSHNAVNPADDPAIQFSAGGRTASLTLAAGGTRAEAALQSGAVAGTIRVTAALEAGGVNVTPAPAPACAITIPRAAPVVTDIRIERTATGFNLLVTGYSSPRQVLESRYRFTPKPAYQWQLIEVVIPPETLSARFTDWFRGGSSAQFGSQFTMLQPFTSDQNVHTLGTVYVILRNLEGLSKEVSASFP